ncbi:MAG: hypothetical protein PHE53_04525 [Thermoguttaceae bacterium]|nr:hypothetical protein [Thermoguttaceae bacterium]
MSLSKKIGIGWFCVLVTVFLLRNWGMADETESPEASEEPRSLYELLEWNVDEYFGDFACSVLCRAIEEMNIDNRIDKCLDLDDGLPPSLKSSPSPELQQHVLSTVNTKGVDNMTPLKGYHGSF